MSKNDNRAAASQALAIEDFAALFGASAGELPPSCTALVEAGNWRYRILRDAERDAVVLELLQRIEKRDFSMVNPADKSRWVRGWGENLKDFVDSRGMVEALAPKYIRPHLPLRLNQEFVRAEDSRFEL